VPTSDLLTPLLMAWSVSALVMAGLWVLQRRHGDAGIVDVGWAACLGGMAVGYGIAGSGALAPRVLVAVLGGAWGLRLAWHLLTDRVLGKQEDGRYAHLRAHWGERADLQFIWFFQLQAVLATLLSVVFLLAASSPAPQLSGWHLAGVVLFVLAKSGESLADRQLARWRADPTHHGRTCRQGLWRYSRHPNYFCEWLIWCAFALLAAPAPGGWLGVTAPLLMLLLVTRVSGIPYTEAQALRSRGDDYRAYQRTTSAFVPWFPRDEAAATQTVSSPPSSTSLCSSPPTSSRRPSEIP
jgi:steroid 5-alpha reductase family enzyme